MLDAHRKIFFQVSRVEEGHQILAGIAAFFANIVRGFQGSGETKQAFVGWGGARSLLRSASGN
mgnify:CR=1 FL=1